MKVSRALVLMSVVATASGCGSGETTDPVVEQSDAGGTGSGSGTTPEVDASGADTDPVEPTYSGTCTDNSIFPYFERGGVRDGERFYYATEEPTGAFSVWYVTVADGVGAGIYDLADTSPETCEVCVYRLDDCDAAAATCGTTVNAVEGVVELTTSSDGRLAGELRHVKFGSEPDAACADAFTFDVGIAPEAAARIGETTYDFSLINCGTGEPMSIHELAAGREGFWMIATAGWCPACRQFIPQVLEMIETIDPMTLDVAFVVGENSEYAEPDLEFCRSYARSYGASPDLFFLDHDGTYSFATTFQYLWPYPTAEGAFGLPWSAIIDGQSYEYLYSDGAGLDLQTVLDGITAP